MTYYIRDGNTFSVTNSSKLDIHTKLPSLTFMVEYSPMHGFYLVEIDSFVVNHKIYGSVNSTIDRIFSTFSDRDGNTGVMLSGEKGSGKTLMAKLLSIEGATRMGMPTIIINLPHTGPEFNTFMQDIDQPCVVIFDEFEKVYNKEHQDAILTLLDGVFVSKKLFAFTCNEKYRINSHMTNRPGRIYYHLEYDGLEADFIREYCNDNLVNVYHIDSLCRLASLYNQFNFDMLKALVEEMNRYDESPVDALRFLNAKPDNDCGGRFNITLYVDGVRIEDNDVSPNELSDAPLKLAVIKIEQYIKNGKKSEWTEFAFRSQDLSRIDADKGEFVYIQGNRQLVIKRDRLKQHSVTEYASRFI